MIEQRLATVIRQLQVEMAVPHSEALRHTRGTHTWALSRLEHPLEPLPSSCIARSRVNGSTTAYEIDSSPIVYRKRSLGRLFVAIVECCNIREPRDNLGEHLCGMTVVPQPKYEHTDRLTC